MRRLRVAVLESKEAVLRIFAVVRGGILARDVFLPPDFLPGPLRVCFEEVVSFCAASLRLFDVNLENGRRAWVENPEVGTYHLAGLE